jgi:hypothetical protein
MVTIRNVQIMMEKEIKHAEEQSLMSGSNHASARVSFITSEAFKPGPQHSLQTLSVLFQMVFSPIDN